jgi:hypothetical protein
MALIIGHSILRQEFGASIPVDDLEVIQRSARIELTTSIKGKGLPKGTRLLKAYATSPSGAKRVVFLLEVEGGDLFLLFYRDKKDPVGVNISIQNKVFQNQLAKHLDALLKDIQDKNYTVYQL